METKNAASKTTQKVRQQKAIKVLDSDSIVLKRQKFCQKIPFSTLVPQTRELWFC